MEPDQTYTIVIVSSSLMDQIRDNGGSEFSKKHQTYIKLGYQAIIDGFTLGSRIPAFICRIGKAEVPSAVAKRNKPEIEFDTL